MKAVAIALAAVVTLSLASTASAETVRCGEVITRSTRVDNDLRNCPGAGLVIGADNITLDLNGHTVDGDALTETGSEAGVANAAGYDGITIRDGAVREFDIGVDIRRATANRVARLSLVGNFQAIVLAQSQGNVVHRNRATFNDVGFSLLNSDRNQVSANLLAAGREGIDLGPFSDRNHVLRNTVAGQFGDAFHAAAGIGNRFERNSAVGNGRGMVLDQTSETLVRQNGLSRSDHYGLWVIEGTRNRVEGNAIARAQLFGILVDGTEDNQFVGNSVRHNVVGIGIRGARQNEIAANGVVQNNIGIEFQFESNDIRIEANKVLRNAEDGVAVNAPSTGTLLRRNHANRNGDDGIDVESSSTTLTENTANGNRDLGIEAVSGVSDGGGNRASGNGNPLECVNVFCR